MVQYKIQLKDGEVTRGTISVTTKISMRDESPEGYEMISEVPGQDKESEPYETYDGALVACLEAVLKLSLSHTTLKSEITYE